MQQRGWEAYAGKLGVELMQSTQECLDWICTQVKGDYVLDADCGQAAVLMLLAREGKTVVGLSRHEILLAQARGFIANEPSEVQRKIDLRASTLLSDGALAEHSFDTVLLPIGDAFANGTTTLVESAFRKLKVDGRLISLWQVGSLSATAVEHHMRHLAERLATRFETTEVRFFGELLAVISKPRTISVELYRLMAAEPDKYGGEIKTIRHVSRFASRTKAKKNQNNIRIAEHALDGDRARSIQINDSAVVDKRTWNASAPTISQENLVEREREEKSGPHKQHSVLLAKQGELDFYARLVSHQVETHQAIRARMQAQDRLLSQVKQRLHATELQLKDAQAQGRRHHENGKQFLEQFRTSQAQEKQAQGKIRNLERVIRNLENQKTQALQQAEQTRKTLSFQLGYALLHAFKSWSSFFGLPKELVRIHKDGKARRERKLLKLAGGSKKPTPKNLRPSKQQPDKSAAKKAALTPTVLPRPELLKKQRLKVAGIMDEFTFHSYAPECDLLQLRPDEWRNQIDTFKPDFIFIESAWKGVSDSWKGLISNCTEDVSGLLNYGREQGIPSIFWNKEDPVHFSTFIPVASLVDHVFTTDVDCLPAYKKALGHDRVSLLPFAAQPSTHNPIEKFTRKDSFNFAGSYYLRYPERQRDFAALVDTVSSIRPVEIYDRNFDNPHPHYEFPQRYTPMILGSLPFAEIDRAYKGYRYGINMNTIKQSQTMFARRVFELLASNTVVVSNFSRGVRLMFGDLVVCSDEASEIKRQLAPVCRTDLAYRKFRLLGLRKVMSQHTYRQRLEYIKATLSGVEAVERHRPIVIIAFANCVTTLNKVIAAFERQEYADKTLYVVARHLETSTVSQSNVHVVQDANAVSTAIQTSDRFELIGRISPTAYYGSQYITDLVLAKEYSAASAFTKIAYYKLDASGTLALQNDGKQYHHTSQVFIERSLFNISKITPDQRQALLNPDESFITIDVLGVGEFHYCEVDAHAELSPPAIAHCSDAVVSNLGASFYGDLIPIAEKVKNTLFTTRDTSDSLPKLTAEQLYETFSTPNSKQIRVSLRNGKLNIRSTMAAEKFGYIYTSRAYDRHELNLVLNSHFQMVTSDTANIKSVFEFQDEAGKKIAHQMNQIGGAHTLAIAPNCERIRIGLRIQGQCNVHIDSLILGSNAAAPSTLLSRAPYLILTKQYPAYDDLYRYGFLHSRVRSYRDAGLAVDVFRVDSTPRAPYREFENVDIVSGDLDLLDKTLSTGQYKKVLVHLLDQKMWSVLEKHLDHVKVDIWVHGAEIQVWQRREFEFASMAPAEVIRQKKLSDLRVKFWKNVFEPRIHPNVHLIFVSEHFANEVTSDLGVSLQRESYSIIHNFIDPDIFEYREKPIEQRTRLLSIRPYASRKYANDLTVACIIELSKRSFFSQLEFNLYGDGDLFDETIAPVRKFANVHCHKRFLSQTEIGEIHKTHGIFLTPTRMDAQGVSRDEAMSSGLVPITNHVAAIPEFVDNDCGFVVPAEDYTAMADAIETLFKNPELFQTKSRNAALRTRRQCGHSGTIEREIELISRVD
jgi:glycosyltransferase involved in cell wall biosynthesis/spore maturation protein CgeB